MAGCNSDRRDAVDGSEDRLAVDDSLRFVLIIPTYYARVEGRALRKHTGYPSGLC